MAQVATAGSGGNAGSADAKELGDKAEEQYRKRNAAFSSVSMQILSYCIGETVVKVRFCFAKRFASFAKFS